MRFGVAAVLTLLIAALLGCPSPKPETASSPAPMASASPQPPFEYGRPEEYAGDASCKSCHAAEFKKHHGGKHATTLWPMVRAELGKLCPPMGQVPGINCVLADEGGKIVWKINDPASGRTLTVPQAIAFGSGKRAQTFLTEFADGTGLELRKSYHADKKLWFVTPGHGELKPDDLGVPYDRKQVRSCVGCHAVYVPQEKLLPPRPFFGVGCESCHGPAKAHIAAVQHGGGLKPSPKFLSLKKLSGTEMISACGRCHRTPENVAKGAEGFTNRFQPYGLSLSRCFKESQNKLTCVTCHDPHEDNSTNQAKYEATCKTCHSAPKTVCPVNTNDKCVSCHMPTRLAMEADQSTVVMADHFIRIWKSDDLKKVSRPTR